MGKYLHIHIHIHIYIYIYVRVSLWSYVVSKYIYIFAQQHQSRTWKTQLFLGLRRTSNLTGVGAPSSQRENGVYCIPKKNSNLNNMNNDDFSHATENIHSNIANND